MLNYEIPVNQRIINQKMNLYENFSSRSQRSYKKGV